MLDRTRRVCSSFIHSVSRFSLHCVVRAYYPAGVVGFKSETSSLSSACCCCSAVTYIVAAVLSKGQEMSENFLKPTCNISANFENI